MTSTPAGAAPAAPSRTFGIVRGMMTEVKSPLWLLEHRSDTYSQCGEDGVLRKVLAMLPDCNRWCVEFGAGDGQSLSNTRALIEDGYSAVLIEAHQETFAELAALYADHEAVTTLNRYVGWEPQDGLDSILCCTGIPVGFDLLCIDIDGNDYHAWAAIQAYHPKAVLIEFNPTIPSHVRFVQTAAPDVCQGASILSLVELGKAQGYELICVLDWNALFVRSEYYPLFGLVCNAPNVLRTAVQYLTWIYNGYDGQVFLAGQTRLMWHPGTHLNEKQMQPLPRWLRRPFQSYTGLQRWAYDLRVAWQRGGLTAALKQAIGRSGKPEG